MKESRFHSPRSEHCQRICERLPPSDLELVRRTHLRLSVGKLDPVAVRNLVACAVNATDHPPQAVVKPNSLLALKLTRTKVLLRERKFQLRGGGGIEESDNAATRRVPTHPQTTMPNEVGTRFCRIHGIDPTGVEKNRSLPMSVERTTFRTFYEDKIVTNFED